MGLEISNILQGIRELRGSTSPATKEDKNQQWIFYDFFKFNDKNQGHFEVFMGYNRHPDYNCPSF